MMVQQFLLVQRGKVDYVNCELSEKGRMAMIKPLFSAIAGLGLVTATVAQAAVVAPTTRSNSDNRDSVVPGTETAEHAGFLGLGGAGYAIAGFAFVLVFVGVIVIVTEKNGVSS